MHTKKYLALLNWAFTAKHGTLLAADTKDITNPDSNKHSFHDLEQTIYTTYGSFTGLKGKLNF